MKITLVSPPYLPEYMRNARCDFVSLSSTQWYPILLGYCGAYLESKGHTIQFIDAPAHGLDHSQSEEMITGFHPDLIVIYSGRKSEDNDLRFGEKLIGKLACKAVLVGPYASIDPEKTLRKSTFIRDLVAGEFEKPVEELANGKPRQAILNLAYLENGTFFQNPPRPYLTGDDLDQIPFLSGFFKKHVDVQKYKTPSEFHPYLDIMTGRGCKWGWCTYCLWVHTYIKGMTYHVRSIPNVIEEFQFIQREMPEIRSVMIQDDTFTEERAHAFAEAMIKNRITMPWSCYARGNLTYETLALMKRAGVRNLHVGYESADQKVLQRIRKGLTVEQMTRFTADARRARVRIHGDFAFGFPGETPEGAKKTIRWACRMNPDTAQFQLMIPFPGTPFFAEMEKNGWLNADGEPDMPQFSNAGIRETAKQAYREFYLSARHVMKCVRHPYEHFFSRMDTMLRAIPAMFWETWKV